MQDREHEIKKLIYIKSEIIRREKKDIRTLRAELESIYEDKKQYRRIKKK